MSSCSFLTTAISSAGGGASDRQEDSPTDHHLRLEEGDSDGQRRSEGGGGGSQVRPIDGGLSPFVKVGLVEGGAQFVRLLTRLHSNDSARFNEDLLNIARTTLSSKLLTHHKDHFAQLAVDAVMRLKGSGNLEAIHVIKKLGASLTDSYLDEGTHGMMS